MKVENSFRRGALDSIPIALAYLAVSFAFGIAGSAKGVPVWAVTLISATCLTSAGQFAGLISITAGGSPDRAGSVSGYHQPKIFYYVYCDWTEA